MVDLRAEVFHLKAPTYNLSEFDSTVILLFGSRDEEISARGQDLCLRTSSMPISTVVPKKLDWPEAHLAFFPGSHPLAKARSVCRTNQQTTSLYI